MLAVLSIAMPVTLLLRTQMSPRALTQTIVAARSTG